MRQADAIGARIVPEKMFTFSLEPGETEPR